MEPIGQIEIARQKVLKDISIFLSTVHELSGRKVVSTPDGIALLKKLRSETYEDLNQIQHEHMILIAVDWLVKDRQWPTGAQWYWNPRQTGDGSEPDLRVSHNGKTILSAEITTSENPVGTIDSRMKSTLEKLAQMEGDKHYFVRSASMAMRAKQQLQRPLEAERPGNHLPPRQRHAPSVRAPGCKRAGERLFPCLSWRAISTAECPCPAHP